VHPIAMSFSARPWVEDPPSHGTIKRVGLVYPITMSFWACPWVEDPPSHGTIKRVGLVYPIAMSFSARPWDAGPRMWVPSRGGHPEMPMGGSPSPSQGRRSTRIPPPPPSSSLTLHHQGVVGVLLPVTPKKRRLLWLCSPPGIHRPLPPLPR